MHDFWSKKGNSAGNKASCTTSTFTDYYCRFNDEEKWHNQKPKEKQQQSMHGYFWNWTGIEDVHCFSQKVWAG